MTRLGELSIDDVRSEKTYAQNSCEICETRNKKMYSKSDLWASSERICRISREFSCCYNCQQITVQLTWHAVFLFSFSHDFVTLVSRLLIDCWSKRKVCATFYKCAQSLVPFYGRNLLFRRIFRWNFPRTFSLASDVINCNEDIGVLKRDSVRIKHLDLRAFERFNGVSGSIFLVGQGCDDVAGCGRSARGKSECEPGFPIFNIKFLGYEDPNEISIRAGRTEN